MSELIKDLGGYIRLPFEVAGSVLTFIFQHILIIIVFAVVMYLLWKFRWDLVEIMAPKKTDQKKEITPEKIPEQAW